MLWLLYFAAVRGVRLCSRIRAGVQHGVASGVLSGVTLIRAVAIGLPAGTAGVLIFDPGGEGLDHLRLTMLMGLVLGQFLTVPVSSVGGVIRARPGKGKLIRPYDFSMGPLLVALGVLVVTQARIVVNRIRIEPPPGGVGDPDGESSMALLAGLSGRLMVLFGLAVPANRVWTRAGTESRPIVGASPDQHQGSGDGSGPEARAIGYGVTW